MDPEGAPSVTLRGVTKRFGDFAAVRDMDLEIARGEFFTMLGPSGCGKTTTDCPLPASDQHRLPELRACFRT